MTVVVVEGSSTSVGDAAGVAITVAAKSAMASLVNCMLKAAVVLFARGGVVL